MDFAVLGYAVVRDEAREGYWIGDEFYSDRELPVAELFPELLEQGEVTNLERAS